MVDVADRDDAIRDGRLVRQPRDGDPASLPRSPAGLIHAETPLSQFRCGGCGYGASCRAAPERCPMCGGTVWDFQEWRPFKQFLDDLDRPLTRDT
jgi:hypothetical protein